MYRKQNWMLTGEKILLVPYSAHHVNRYHSWMQDPQLRELTASEPLSLEQEHQMQQSWQNDKNKCTFMVLSVETYNDPTQTEIEAMIGDVNLFFSSDAEGRVDYSSAEIDIMIAEHSARRKGMGYEAARLLMAYGAVELGVKTFQAKIGAQNEPSLRLFRSKLDFKEVSFSEVFKEVTLELKISNGQLLQLKPLCSYWTKYLQKTE